MLLNLLLTLQRKLSTLRTLIAILSKGMVSPMPLLWWENHLILKLLATTSTSSFQTLAQALFRLCVVPSNVLLLSSLVGLS
ncbi:hypothetical protein BHM03_00059073 [Ensete ventricosum]|uniref:Uncharacterized protein n=1 Tax=Ensete ventricosum TaxID=4639 RepID=A0A427B2G5_ENSVE|nr:hypothetical protein B296_00005347 [Ensete ventricosum]RZS25820.1 hypothetical protein BHM03_00059073 [Ensete ventricosum]